MLHKKTITFQPHACNDTVFFFSLLSPHLHTHKRVGVMQRFDSSDPAHVGPHCIMDTFLSSEGELIVLTCNFFYSFSDNKHS